MRLPSDTNSRNSSAAEGCSQESALPLESLCRGCLRESVVVLSVGAETSCVEGEILDSKQESGWLSKIRSSSGSYMFCMCCCCVSICCCQVHRHIIGCAKKQTRRVSTAASRHFSPRQQHTSTCGFMCLPSYLCVSRRRRFLSSHCLLSTRGIVQHHFGGRPIYVELLPRVSPTQSSRQREEK